MLIKLLAMTFTSELDLISGNTDFGTSKNLSSNGSHFKFSIFINIVLEAFVTSVTCFPPLGPPGIKELTFKFTDNS